MTTEQKCRQIFEALGHRASGRGWFHAPTCDGKGTIANAWEGCDFARHQKDPPNFYDSAEASMGLLCDLIRYYGFFHASPMLLKHIKANSETDKVTNEQIIEAIAEAFRASRGLKDE